MSSGVPFLFQDTLGGGIPVLSQLSTALIPVVTVTLNEPGLIEGPTDKKQDSLGQQLRGLFTANTAKCILLQNYIKIINYTK